MNRSDYQLLIDAIVDGGRNKAVKVRTVLEALADSSGQTGDVIEIDVSTAYISANFDSTGLGINERLGWAICNGNNGTRNRGGRVPLGYDATNYPTLGATGGSEDAVVVAHTHTAGLPSNTGGVPGSGGIQYNGANNNTVTVTTASTGVSGTGKNMQPYIVTLYIMKL